MADLIFTFESKLFQVLFIVGIWGCCIALVGVMILKLSALGEPRTERILARAALICGAPLLAAGVHILARQLRPLFVTVLLWIVFVLYHAVKILNKKKAEETLIREQGLWRCPKCNNLNNSQYMRCFKCETSKLDAE